MLTHEAILTDYQSLVERLNTLAYAYYVADAPQVEDAEYDALYQQLLALEQAHPDWIAADSPTQRVGSAPLSAFETVTHPVRLYSLDNVFSLEPPSGEPAGKSLRDWTTRLQNALNQSGDIPLVAEMKIDGLAVSLLYEEGQLIRAATRGNGVQGENVTANVRTIRSLPKKLRGGPNDWPRQLEVRAEIFMPGRSFVALNHQREAAGESLFANPRNAAAGSIRQLDPRIAASRDLDAFIFGATVLDAGVLFQPYSTLWDWQQWLASAGFRVNPERRLCSTFEEAAAFVEAMAVARHEFDYGTDGVVLKVNDTAAQEQLGYTAKAPRWAVAYKYAPEVAATTVIEMEFSVGRTGVITPVAHLEPVLISGSTVQRASLHNFEELARKDVRLGDTVEVHKAAEIIPELLRVLEAFRPNPLPQRIEPPLQCPACGTSVIRRGTEIALRCPNVASCPAQVQNRLEHWVSKQAMDIDSIGPAVLAQLVERELVREPLDLYSLTYDQFLTLDEVKEKSATTFVQSIEQSKRQSAERLLTALGIPQVGYETANVLLDNLISIETVARTSARTFQLIDGVGPEVAASVARFFAQPANQTLVSQLTTLGFVLEKDHPLRRSLAKLTPAVLLHRFKIPKLGLSTANRLLEQAGSIRLLAEADRKQLDCWTTPALAQSLHNWMQQADNQAWLEELEALGFAIQQHMELPPNGQMSLLTAPSQVSVIGSDNLPLLDQTYVVTGTLASMSREEAEGRLRELGAKIASSVSRKTTAVVAGDKPGGNKITAATHHQIPVVNEAEFLAMLSKQE